MGLVRFGPGVALCDMRISLIMPKMSQTSDDSIFARRKENYACADRNTMQHRLGGGNTGEWFIQYHRNALQCCIPHILIRCCPHRRSDHTKRSIH